MDPALKKWVTASLVVASVVLSVLYIALALSVPLRSTLNTLGAPASPPPFSTATLSTPMEKAKAIQAQYPLIDGHNDLPWEYRKYANNSVLDPRVDIARNISFGEFYTNIPLYSPVTYHNRFYLLFKAFYFPHLLVSQKA